MEIERIGPGRRERIEIGLDGDGGARLCTIQVHALAGRASHPCLALVAGVHGDEYDGMLALQEIAAEIVPTDLEGSLIVIPVANPLAFAAAQRRTPQDNVDLNRVFPGRADGGLTERLARLLCTAVLGQADLIFTLHGGMATDLLAPWIEFQDVPGPVGRASYAAALASGFPDLVALPRLPGVLLGAMIEAGVPLVEGEVGGRGATRAENVAYYKERVYALARHAGVLPSAAPPAAVSDPGVWHLNPVTAGASRILRMRVGLKQAVVQGEVLGTVVDGQDGAVSEVRAPAPGLIGGYREHAGVRADDVACTLWTPAAPRIHGAV